MHTVLSAFQERAVNGYRQLVETHPIAVAGKTVAF
jgi:hypothetical protein